MQRMWSGKCADCSPDPFRLQAVTVRALLGWVVSWWQGTQRALAIEATALGARFVVLAVSVVGFSQQWDSIPSRPHAWHPHRRAWRCWGKAVNSGRMAWIIHPPRNPGGALLCASHCNAFFATMMARNTPSPTSSPCRKRALKSGGTVHLYRSDTQAGGGEIPQ
jgi:hypothetical protein